MPFEGRSTFFRALHNIVYKQIKFNRLMIKLGLNKRCLNVFNNFNYYDHDDCMSRTNKIYSA